MSDLCLLLVERRREQAPVRSVRYETDVLAAGPRKPKQAELPRILAQPGLVVEDAAGQFCGAVMFCEKDAVTLEDRDGKLRVFPLDAIFLMDGKRIRLVRPSAAPTAGRTAGRTASGSIAAPQSRAKVARASRIYVEGRHDAELVEKIWGDDLRDVGVVVEYLGGIDDLPAIVADFAPGPVRRLGVLVDHLVSGSKETRIAAQVTSANVLIVGHPFIDVWAAVKPSAVGNPALAGRAARPAVEGRCIDRPGLAGPRNTGAGWQRILSRVTSFADLEPSFLGRVEELIDFVTEPGSG